MDTLKASAQRASSSVVKHLNVRLRKIRSLKTSVLANKPLKTTARGLETKPPGTVADQQP